MRYDIGGPYSICCIHLSKHFFEFEESTGGFFAKRQNTHDTGSRYDNITTFDELKRQGVLTESPRKNCIVYNYKNDIILEECIWKILHNGLTDFRLSYINLDDKEFTVERIEETDEQAGK